MVRTIRRLKAQGYAVHVVDRNGAAPGFAAADGGAPIDVADAVAVEEYARRIKADLLLPVNDLGVMTASRASAVLGLPSLPVEAAIRCVEKAPMRRYWEAAGLRQPQFLIGRTIEEMRDAATALGYPVIVKPSFGWGSRGVSVAETEADLAWSVQWAAQELQNGCRELVIEKLIPGREMTIEGLVRDGTAHVLAWSDKEGQEHPRYRVAMALNYPAQFAPADLAEARTLVCKAVKALGIVNGAFHCECMVNSEGVWLIEAAARGGGGHIFGQIVEAVSGVCMPVALVRLLLGQPVDLAEKPQRGACYRFFVPPPGIFEAVHGLDEAARMPGVLDIGFQMTPGTAAGAVAGDASRPGYVVTAAATRQEAMRRAEVAIGSLAFQMREPATEAVA